MQRLREQITHSQTRCRCGHLLAACADCRDWLIDHGPRIASAWRWYVNCVAIGDTHRIAGTDHADAFERADLAYYFEAGR